MGFLTSPIFRHPTHPHLYMWDGEIGELDHPKTYLNGEIGELLNRIFSGTERGGHERT